VLPAPPAPELDTLNILSNGNFVFSMVGPVASNCTVQVSSDLKVCNNAVTITNFNGLAHIIDASGNTNHEFYRAMLTETPPVNLEYQDLANTSLGNASESIACCVSNLGSSGQDGLTLVVSNLGSSGQDGVSIALPTNLTGLDAQWQDLDDANTLPV